MTQFKKRNIFKNSEYFCKILPHKKVNSYKKNPKLKTL